MRPLWSSPRFSRFSVDRRVLDVEARHQRQVVQRTQAYPECLHHPFQNPGADVPGISWLREAVVIIGFVDLVVVLQADIQPANGIPVDAGAVLLNEAILLHVQDHVIFAGGEIPFKLVAVAIAPGPFTACIKDPVGKAGVAQFQGAGDIQEIILICRVQSLGDGSPGRRRANVGFCKPDVTILVFLGKPGGWQDAQMFPGPEQKVEVCGVLVKVVSSAHVEETFIKRLTPGKDRIVNRVETFTYNS
jgi:hypothetical protein